MRPSACASPPTARPATGSLRFPGYGESPAGARRSTWRAPAPCSPWVPPPWSNAASAPLTCAPSAPRSRTSSSPAPAAAPRAERCAASARSPGSRRSSSLETPSPPSSPSATAPIAPIPLPVPLADSRERGVLKRFHASSIPATAVLGSQVAVGLAVATLGSLLLLALGAAGYDAPAPSAPLAATAAYLLGTAAFLAVGFLLAPLLPTAPAPPGPG